MTSHGFLVTPFPLEPSPSSYSGMSALETRAPAPHYNSSRKCSAAPPSGGRKCSAEPPSGGRKRKWLSHAEGAASGAGGVGSGRGGAAGPGARPQLLLAASARQRGPPGAARCGEGTRWGLMSGGRPGLGEMGGGRPPGREALSAETADQSPTRVRLRLRTEPAVSAGWREAVAAAVGALQEGGLVAVPTDTVYGVACLAQDSRAVQTIYSLKGRNGTKPLAICLGDVEHIYR